MECSITGEEIKEYGITETGSIYSYSAIIKWLEENHTDPLTNIKISNRVIKLEDKSIDFVKEEAQKIKTHFLLILKGKHLLDYLPFSTVSLKKIFDTKSSLLETNGWKDYEKYKANQIFEKATDFTSVHEAIKYNVLLNSPLDRNDEVTRPANSGYGFEFINFSKILGHCQVYDGYFKESSFNGADLSNMEFIDCNFTNCTFMGTNLKKTIFINCSFCGESVNFYGSSISDATTFLNCDIEKVLSTVIINSAKDHELFNKIVIDRGYGTKIEMLIN